MLPLKETVNPKAIENIICKPFEALPVQSMDKDQFEIFVRLYINPCFIIPDAEKPFLFKVIEKRIEYVFNFAVIDDRLLLFLAYISETPGTAILYLWYLQYWIVKNKYLIKDKILTFDIFCKNIFPNGFPSKKDLHTIWQNQKVLSKTKTNLVDYTTAGKSLLTD